MDDTAVNPLDALVSQYKQGYKTSEFWVALAAGIVPAVTAGIDPNKRLSDQLNHVVWVAIAYILARGGLKVARVTTHGKVVTALATSTPAAAPVTVSTNGAPDPGAAIDLEELKILVALRDRGIITQGQIEQAQGAPG
jgi:hypothetical protein